MRYWENNLPVPGVENSRAQEPQGRGAPSWPLVANCPRDRALWCWGLGEALRWERTGEKGVSRELRGPGPGDWGVGNWRTREQRD